MDDLANLTDMSHYHQSGSSPSSRRPYRRAAVACKACNARKVRCTVELSGRPCARCAADGITCEIAQRKTRINPDQLPFTAAVGQNEFTAAASQMQPREQRLSPPPPQSDRSTQLQSIHLHDDKERYRIMDMVPLGVEKEDYFFKGQTCPAQNPYYLGDERSLRGFVTDPCHGDSSSLPTRHVSLSPPTLTALDTHDLSYAKQKGCLSLPPRALTDELLRSYFHYVHPFAPIIDVEEFMQNYMNKQLSLLLFWSIFTAAGSFIDEQLLTGEFGRTRIELKDIAFQRAKVLYELDYEKNTITLIQSVYLMSYRLGSVDNARGSWYWTGISISLACTAGLHHLPPCQSSTEDMNSPALWSQLWWSIYIRETWLSLAYGRPMRIDKDEVTTPILIQNEVIQLSRRSCDMLYQKYLPLEINNLVTLWLCLVRITVSLGYILNNFYGAKAARPTQQQIKSIEDNMSTYFRGILAKTHENQLITLHSLQMRVCIEATLIVLYRPHIIQSSSSTRQSQTVKEGDGSLKILCCRKMRAAALRATHLINVLIGEDQTRNIHMLTVIAVVLPMQIHLRDLQSSSSPIRQAGGYNLHLCMVLLDSLRGTYVSADTAHGIFQAAITKIKCGSLLEESILSTPAATGIFDQSDAMSTEENTVIGDGFNCEDNPMASNTTSYLDWLPLLSPTSELFMLE